MYKHLALRQSHWCKYGLKLTVLHNNVKYNTKTCMRQIQKKYRLYTLLRTKTYHKRLPLTRKHTDNLALDTHLASTIRQNAVGILEQYTWASRYNAFSFHKTRSFIFNIFTKYVKTMSNSKCNSQAFCAARAGNRKNEQIDFGVGSHVGEILYV